MLIGIANGIRKIVWYCKIEKSRGSSRVYYAFVSQFLIIMLSIMMN